MDSTLPTNAVFFGVDSLRVYGPIVIVLVALSVRHDSSAAAVKGSGVVTTELVLQDEGVALFGRGS